MNILVLFISSGIALIMLIIHSYLYRGSRITLNFFIFAFIWAFHKEGGTPPSAYAYLKLYEFLNENVTIALKYLTATVGWIFTLYISWSIAERILRRITFFRNKIFPTLFISAVVVSDISYSIETTAINMGWWRWNINHQTLKYLFIGGYSLFTMEAWLFFTTVFLAAFFLIECSKYRNARWKAVFAILPFIYSWAILRIGPRMPNPHRELIGLIQYFILPLTILAFLSPLSFECGYISPEQPSKPKRIISIAKDIPLLMFLFMFLILVWIDLVSLRKPILLISVIPVIFSVLLSVRRIPLCLIFSLSLFSLVLGKEKMIIPILPVIAVFGFWAVDKFKIASLHKKALLQPSKD